MKRVHTFCLFTLLVFAVAGPVNAIPPAVSTDEVHINGNLGSCGDFEILRTAHYTVTQTTFFNGDGEVVRTMWRYDGEETFTNSVTGYSLAGMPTNALLEFIPSLDDPNIQLTRGFLLGCHVPGLGMVMLNAGNVTFDISSFPFTITFQHGTFTNLFFSEDDPQLERICNALRGPSKPDTPEPTWGMLKQLYR